MIGTRAISTKMYRYRQALLKGNHTNDESEIPVCTNQKFASHYHEKQYWMMCEMVKKGPRFSFRLIIQGVWYGTDCPLALLGGLKTSWRPPFKALITLYDHL